MPASRASAGAVKNNRFITSKPDWAKWPGQAIFAITCSEFVTGATPTRRHERQPRCGQRYPVFRTRL